MTNEPVKPSNLDEKPSLRICHIDFSLIGNSTNSQYRYCPANRTITDFGKQSYTLQEITAMLEAGRLLRSFSADLETNFEETMNRPVAYNDKAKGKP